MGTTIVLTAATMAISLLVGSLQMHESEERQKKLADEQMNQSQAYSEQQYARSLADQERIYTLQKRESENQYKRQLADERALIQEQERNADKARRTDRRAQLRSIYGGK